MPMNGHQLKELLRNPEGRAERLRHLSNSQVSEILSKVLIRFEFDLFEFDIVSEACMRLDDHSFDHEDIQEL